MSEFTIHSQVYKLLNNFGVQSGQAASAYTDALTRNITPYVTTQVSAHSAKRKIASFSSTPNEFLMKYDELKSRNTRDLDALVFLLSKLTEDKRTLKVLANNAKDKSSLAASSAGVTTDRTSAVTTANTNSASKLSEAELTLLRSQLLSDTSISQVPQHTPAEFRKALRDKYSKKNGSVVMPTFPTWVYERPYLTNDFVNIPGHPVDQSPDITALSPNQKEHLILQDILFLMIGAEGQFVHPKPLVARQSKRTFDVDLGFDPSLNDLVKRILPLCSDYSNVCRFIEEKSSFEYGLVNHALCGAINTMLKEYMILVAQLEHQLHQGNLTTQKLWFYIQPCMKTVSIISAIVTSINKGECTGGSVLSLLHEKTTSYVGDSKSQDLCLFLTQTACVPYFEILEKWIYNGVIHDPYCEFLVEENDISTRESTFGENYTDPYWEKRYTICRERIPVFLEKVAEMVLKTGKYLNVVRQSGRTVQFPGAVEIIYTLKERQYVDQIDNAHQYASKLLLDLLINTEGLLTRLDSIKRYYLMGQGDMFTQFMDIAESELRKSVEDIMPARLESLLELAVRTSASNSDPHKDDLKIVLLPYDLVTQLFRILSIETHQEKALQLVDPTEIHITGLEAIAIELEVDWPLSILLNKKAMTRYQMLFRYVFYMKHVERQLCSVWLMNKEAKQFRLHSSPWYAAAFTLRDRMLNCIKNLELYIMFEVLEAAWHVFRNKIKTVSTVDELIKQHEEFLDRCMRDCMLTNPNLLKIISKLMVVCVTFANSVQRLVQSSHLDKSMSILHDSTLQATAMQFETDYENQMTTKVESRHVDEMTASSNFELIVETFDTNFTRHLLDLIDKLSQFSNSDCHDNLVNVIYRLDFNGYYTTKLEHRAAERSMFEESVATSIDSEGSESGSNTQRSQQQNASRAQRPQPRQTRRQ